MRIAILMTNTDESDFAQRHPKDGEKFPALLREVRPDWEFDVYSVKDGEFPETLDGVDGVLITGSPASVHDGAAWIGRLEALIRDLAEARLPVFGACFGHQAIAKALGGTVDYNPQGWVLGSVQTRLFDLDRTVSAYAAHKEQVTQVPETAQVMSETPGCPIAGFAIGTHILTTQYHPEMTDGFVAALLEEMAGETDPEVIRSAKDSLSHPADRQILAEWMAQFFEKAAVQAT